MNRRLLLLVLLVSVLYAPSSAWARRYYSRGRSGYGGGGTAYSSIAGGMGSLIRAQGAYNQMTAQALVTLEQAKSAAIKNKLDMTQTYYQLRRLNEQEHAAEKRKRLALYAPAPHEMPLRLTASQLDPVTGEITWMPLLLDPAFAAERLELQNLFIRRAAHDAPVTNTQVAAVVDALRDKLDAKHDRVTTSDFFAARHFLEALEAESRYTGNDHPPLPVAGK